jgi:hypothetical protein
MRVRNRPAEPELSTWLRVGTFYLALTGWSTGSSAPTRGISATQEAVQRRKLLEGMLKLLLPIRGLSCEGRLAQVSDHDAVEGPAQIDSLLNESFGRKIEWHSTPVLVHCAHSTMALAEGDEDSVSRTLRVRSSDCSGQKAAETKTSDLPTRNVISCQHWREQQIYNIPFGRAETPWRGHNRDIVFVPE